MNKEKEKTYINSVENFNKWINIINTHDKKEMVYRGLKDEAWDLSASLYRRLENNKLQTDMQRFIKATEELIKTAKGEGHHEKMTNLNLLAELQHNGAATCLIDFTKSPLVALWFACEPVTKEELSKKPKGYKPKGGKIVMLNTKFFPPVDLEKSKKNTKSFLDKKKEHLQKWSPPKQNNRIIAQQSVFILGKGKIDNKEIDETCFVKEAKKRKILDELEKYGISGNSLFCDFSGFAQQNASDKPYEHRTFDDQLHSVSGEWKEEQRKKR